MSSIQPRSFPNAVYPGSANSAQSKSPVEVTPTPGTAIIENAVTAAYDKYTTALQAFQNSKATFSKPLHGSFVSRNQSNVTKSLAELSTIYTAAVEDDYFRRTIEKSIEEFRESAIAKGEDPDKAEADWNALCDALKTTPCHRTITIENVQNDLPYLDKEEITDFINSLSPEQLRQLAPNSFDSSMNDEWRDMPAEHLRLLLIDTLSDRSLNIQRDIPLIERPRAHEIIQQAFLEQPALIAHQGLRNSGVDCYLNSALQCLRQHFSNFSQVTQQRLLTSLREKYRAYGTTAASEQGNLVLDNSPLVAFLEGKFDGRNLIAASFLRLEVRRTMQELVQSGKNSSEAARSIVKNIDVKTGNSSQQGDSSEALIALMEYVGAPPINIKDERVYYDKDRKEIVRAQQEQKENNGDFVLPFGIERAAAFQEVIQSNFLNDITQNSEEALGGSSVYMKRKVSNPPDSLTCSLNRFAIDSNSEQSMKLHIPITGLTDTVTFPTDSESGNVAYTPVSIICHVGQGSANSGHYVTFRKENESWFFVSDATVTQVNLDSSMNTTSGMTYRKFLEENAYVLNFQKRG